MNINNLIPDIAGSIMNGLDDLFTSDEERLKVGQVRLTTKGIAKIAHQLIKYH